MNNVRFLELIKNLQTFAKVNSQHIKTKDAFNRPRENI
jgi:hypothetical protein